MIFFPLCVFLTTLALTASIDNNFKGFKHIKIMIVHVFFRDVSGTLIAAIPVTLHKDVAF